MRLGSLGCVLANDDYSCRTRGRSTSPPLRISELAPCVLRPQMKVPQGQTYNKELKLGDIAGTQFDQARKILILLHQRKLGVWCSIFSILDMCLGSRGDFFC